MEILERPKPFVGGIDFGEGPRWHDGRLWFSDFYQHAVKAASLDGTVEVVLEMSGQPSGLGWLPNGDLLLVSMLDRKVLRYDGTDLHEHADLSEVATFHCNDMVVDAQGRPTWAISAPISMPGLSLRRPRWPWCNPTARWKRLLLI